MKKSLLLLAAMASASFAQTTPAATTATQLPTHRVHCVGQDKTPE